MLVKNFSFILLMMTAAVVNAAKDPAVVVVFGDSITAGFNFELDFNGNPNSNNGNGDGQTNFGIPDQELARLLTESRRNSVVVNWGLGSTPSGPGGDDLFGNQSGSQRIPFNLAQTREQIVGSQYIVLIMYGTNDFSQGLVPSTTGFNNALMIVRARQQGFTPIVSNLTPRDDQNNAAYNAAIKSEAANFNATFVDQFANFSAFPESGFSLLQTEFSSFKNTNIRLHPTNEGYRVIAQHWFDAVLADLIKRTPPVLAPILLLLEEELLLDEE